MKTNRIVLASLLSLGVLAMTACSAPPRNARNGVFADLTGAAKTSASPTPQTPLVPSSTTLVDPKAPVATGETAVEQSFSREQIDQLKLQYAEESRAFSQNIDVLPFAIGTLDTFSPTIVISEKVDENIVINSYSLKYLNTAEEGLASYDVLKGETKDTSLSASASIEKGTLTLTLIKLIDGKVLTSVLTMDIVPAKYQVDSNVAGGAVASTNSRLSKTGDVLIEKVQVRALADEADVTAGKIIFIQTFAALVDQTKNISVRGEITAQEYGKATDEAGVNVSLTSLDSELKVKVEEIIKKGKNEQGKSTIQFNLNIQLEPTEGAIGSSNAVAYVLLGVDAPAAETLDEAQAPVVEETPTTTDGLKPGNQDVPAGEGIETKLTADVVSEADLSAEVTAAPEVAAEAVQAPVAKAQPSTAKIDFAQPTQSKPAASAAIDFSAPQVSFQDPTKPVAVAVAKPSEEEEEEKPGFFGRVWNSMWTTFSGESLAE